MTFTRRTALRAPLAGAAALASSPPRARLARAGTPPLPDAASYGDAIAVTRDLAYAIRPEPHQFLDVYRPVAGAPARRLPAVVCYFGSGFKDGGKTGMAKVAAFLAARGLCAVTPGYFLARLDAGWRGWPRNVHDAKCAVRFLRAHAVPLGVDPARIATLGHSSGAYLAMMVGFSARERALEGGDGWAGASSRVAAVVNIAGVCDRRGGLGTGTLQLLGPGYESDAELRRRASPIVYLDRSSPPVYTLHGEQDDNVLPAAARQLDAALRRLGVPHALHLVPDAGHDPISTATMPAVADWLRARLGLGGRA